MPTLTRAWYCFGLNWFGSAWHSEMRANDTHFIFPRASQSPLCRKIFFVKCSPGQEAIYGEA